MKYIITGATGFIGKNFIKNILRKKNQEIIIISGKSKFKIRDKNNQITYLNKIKFLKIDYDLSSYHFYHLATNYNPYPKNFNELQDVITSNLRFGLDTISHFKNQGGNKVYYTRSYSELQDLENIYSKTKTILHDLIIQMNFKNYKYIFLYDTYGHNDVRKKFLNIVSAKLKNNQSIILNEKNIKIYITNIDDIIDGLNKLKSIKINRNYSLRPKKLITLEEVIYKIKQLYGIKKVDIKYKMNTNSKVLPINIDILPGWNAGKTFDEGLLYYLNKRNKHNL